MTEYASASIEFVPDSSTEQIKAPSGWKIRIGGPVTRRDGKRMRTEDAQTALDTMTNALLLQGYIFTGRFGFHALSQDQTASESDGG